MQLISTLLSLLLFVKLSTTIRGTGEVTPCFIPLPGLAFTDFNETWPPNTTIPTSAEFSTDSTFSEQLSTTTEEASGSTETTPGSERSNHGNATTHISTSGESVEDTSTSTQPSTSNEPTNDIANDTENPTGSEIISEATTQAMGETSTTSMSMPTERVTSCTPYCAALDENDRCVRIKGCGYDEGNFGRHGCCPPGYYSESEVVGLTALTALIIAMILCTRG